MRLHGLAPLLAGLAAYRRLRNGLERADGACCGVDLMEAARPCLVAALQADREGPLVVMAGSPEEATRFHQSLEEWSPAPEDVLLFPAPDAMFREPIPWDAETAIARMRALARLAAGRGLEGLAIVTSARALMQKTVPPDALREKTRTLRAGQRIDLWELAEALVDAGYEPSFQVEGPGSFSRRGGIVDIYSPCHALPVRIELFGDEVESLRFFDPLTQKSLEPAQEAAICPTGEAFQLLEPQAALERLEAAGISVRPPLDEETGRLAAPERYLPWLYPHSRGLLDHLPQRALLVMERLRLRDEVATLEARALEHGDRPEGGPIPYLTWDDLEEDFGERRRILFAETGLEEGIDFKQIKASPSYGGQLKRALDDASEWRAQGDRVVMVTRQADRIADLWRERDVRATPVEAIQAPPAAGELAVVRGTAAQGWRSPGLSILTDGDLFGWVKARRAARPRRRRDAAAAEAFFAELKPGDHVVHIEHGIGVYQGLTKRRIDSSEKEFLLLEYAAGDRLYVPTSQADRVSRYVGGGEGGPALHRLGTADWGRVKAQARQAIEDLADELLELYAARQVVPGHAFGPDTAWQREMESAFPYVETEDQIVAIEAVKGDMERPVPMDRLICGDVGYGKTEVALRAAFKAVMDGKQVAILVPTTVLAQQHTETFQTRLGAYPIRVEMLSRFRTPAEQEEVIEGLRSGKVDIAIGTHRLLQEDVAFKDLGLLVIDEEQRFGVTHKERLKRMRKEVDVLTLTATPIPRTLHLAMMGARDMSTIDTPPEERLPIRTVIAAYDEDLIGRAIRREMERGGQVYFVHNRVQGIEQVAKRLRRIVPEARLAVGHGQMPEAELARVMRAFVAQETDVLACTSIIESGLDIPNANTIIVNRADRFGLAQLYQLRGRVGRGAERAYAYLLHSPAGEMSEVARKRLRAIFEADELGAGFRVAMQDMEIRGVGDILGSRQHGHISAIGFDLYCRLLARAIEDRREGKRPEVGEVTASLPAVELPLEAHLPEDYVPDGQARLKLYRRMAQQDSLEGVEGIAEEIRDRFGELPRPVENLLYVLRLRVLAARGGLRSISLEGKRVAIRPNGEVRADWRRLPVGLVQVGREKIHLRVDARTAGGRRELLELLERAVSAEG